jgi:hypothetical protein
MNFNVISMEVINENPKFNQQIYHLRSINSK